MSKQSVVLNNFSGGISNDLKISIPNGFLFSKNLDIFQDASYITVNPKAIKVSGTTITNLPLWMVDGSPFDTNRYIYDLGGNLYQVDNTDVFTNIRTVAGSQGQGLGILNDYLYYAGNITLGRYGPLSLTPTFNDNFLADGFTNLDQNQSLTGQTYAVPVAISEASTDRLTFIPAQDPINSISIYIVAKGTGNWTITVHDDQNNNLGSTTVSNASLNNGALNTFTFDPQIRVVIGNSYHFHVTSTVADGTLQTGTSNDLETATYNEYFGILIAADYHPIMQLLNGIVIGNDNYLAFWNQAIYNPNQITIPTGYHIRTIAWWNELIVAGAWKGDSESSVEDSQLFFWDGISPTFNYSVEVSNGIPNALSTLDNGLIGVYGEIGELFLDSAPFTLVHEVPLLANNSVIEVAPAGMDAFQAKMAIGYAKESTDLTGMQMGVYLWGNKTDQFPEVLSYAYTLASSTTQGTNLKISLVKGIGDSLYIGWREGSNYGVDKVSKSNDPYPTGEFNTLIFDNGFPSKPKYADILVIEFEPLAADVSITPKYAIDDNAFNQNFTLGATIGTGATQAVLPIGKRFNNISWGFNITQSTSFPKITGLYFYFDDLIEERDWA